MKLFVCGLEEVDRYRGTVSHLLSMVDPDDVEFVPDLGLRSDCRLLLRCDDVESLSDARAREREYPGSRCIAPTSVMVRKALAFAAGVPDSGSLLIHCGFGVSRSTALAFAILCQAEPKLAEGEVLKRVLVIRPQAAPNVYIVKMADAILRRKGKMSRALQVLEERQGFFRREP